MKRDIFFWLPRMNWSVLFLLLSIHLAGQPVDNQIFNTASNLATSATLSQRQGNFDQSILQAKNAFSIYQRANWPDGMVNSYNLIANNYLHMLQLDSAKVYIEKTKELSVDQSRLSLLSFSAKYHVQAKLALDMGLADSCIQILYKSLNIIDTTVQFFTVDTSEVILEPKSGIWLLKHINELILNQTFKNYVRSQNYTIIGSAYFYKGDFEQAEHFLGLAEKYASDGLISYKDELKQFELLKDENNPLVSDISKEKRSIRLEAFRNNSSTFAMLQLAAKAFAKELELSSIKARLNLARTHLANSNLKKEYSLAMAEKVLGQIKIDDGEIDFYNSYGLLFRDLGRVAFKRNRLDSALMLIKQGNNYLERALRWDYVREINLPRNIVIVQGLIEELEVLTALNHKTESYQLLNHILEEVRNLQNKKEKKYVYNLAELWIQIGRLQNQLKQSHAAKLSIAESIKLITAENTPFSKNTLKTIEEIPLNNFLNEQIFIALAESSMQLYEMYPDSTYLIKMARDYYNSGLNALNQRRIGFTGAQNYLFTRETPLFNLETLARNIVNGVICAEYKLRNIQSGQAFEKNVFHYIQNVKAYVLMDQMNNNLNRRNQYNSSLLKNLDSKIRTFESNYQLAINRNDSQSINTSRQEWVKIQLEIDNSLKRAEFQSLGSLWANGNFPSLSSAQASLDDSTAILEYYWVSSSELRVIFIARQYSKSIVLPIPENLPALIHQFNLISKTDRYNELTWSDFGRIGNQLYKLLLEPLVKDLSSYKCLVICPDRELYQLNFELFSSRLASNYQEILNAMIIRTHTITSISSFATFKLKNDFDYSNYRSRVNLHYGGVEPIFNQNWIYANQKGTDRFNEVRKVYGNMGKIPIDTFPGEGNKAMLSNWLNTRYFKTLHLCTHGLYNSTSPMESSLLLYGSTKEEAFLKIWEIYQLNLAAELVIVSACDIGKGELLSAGEGPLSIARGFMANACKGVIYGQWSLDSESSSKIISNFFAKLKGSTISVAHALRKAKLEYLNDSSKYEKLPYYWAGLNYWGPLQRISLF